MCIIFSIYTRNLEYGLNGSREWNLYQNSQGHLLLKEYKTIFMIIINKNWIIDRFTHYGTSTFAVCI